MDDNVEVGYDEIFRLPDGRKILFSSNDTGVAEAYIQLDLQELETLKAEVVELVNSNFELKDYASLEHYSGLMSYIKEVQNRKMGNLLPPSG